MKSPINHPITQVVLISITLMAISIACSASRSAESPAVQAGNASTDQLLTSPPTSATQDKTPCNLNLSSAPNIKGLKLGMTPDEVLALFPGSKEDAEIRTQLGHAPTGVGTSQLVIRPLKYGTTDSTKPAAVGAITRINLSFLDGRLMSFNVGFNGPAWPHVDDFVTRLATDKNLPLADQWEVQVGLDNQVKNLTCADFSVRVFAGGEGGNLNHIIVQDLDAEKKVTERRKKARGQASPTPAVGSE
jgi:hypothetical protein